MLTVIKNETSLFTLGRGAHHLYVIEYESVHNSWRSLNTFSALLDDFGWNRPEHYLTLQTVVLNNKFYVTGRGTDAIHLIEYDTAHNSWRSLNGFSIFSNASGWNRPEYYLTLKTTTLNNKVYITGRGAHHFYVIEYDPMHNSWRSLSELIAFSDASGWNRPEYYLTLQTIALNNKLYVMGRGAHTIHLVEYDPAKNSWQSLNGFLTFTDASSWNRPEYYLTLQITVLNSRLYITGRGAHHFYVIEYTPTENSWQSLSEFSIFSDASGWNRPEYYLTLQTTVLNSKLYITGRGAHHFYVVEYDPFENNWQSLSGFSMFSDASGWNRPEYYLTLQTVALNNKLYVIGRGADIMHFVEYDPFQDSWQSLSGFLMFSDASGWNRPQYYLRQRPLELAIVREKLSSHRRGFLEGFIDRVSSAVHHPLKQLNRETIHFSEYAGRGIRSVGKDISQVSKDFGREVGREWNKLDPEVKTIIIAVAVGTAVYATGGTISLVIAGQGGQTVTLLSLSQTAGVSVPVIEAMVATASTYAVIQGNMKPKEEPHRPSSSTQGIPSSTSTPHRASTTASSTSARTLPIAHDSRKQKLLDEIFDMMTTDLKFIPALACKITHHPLPCTIEKLTLVYELVELALDMGKKEPAERFIKAVEYAMDIKLGIGFTTIKDKVKHAYNLLNPDNKLP
jgi:hypothetical protein